MRNNRYAILALTLLLPGCTMAPKYERPAAPVPDNWAVTHMGKPAGSTQVQSRTAGSLASIKWREYFVDSQLQRLIELALANNRDLRVAALNIEKSRAQYQIKRADLLPTISATGSGTVQRIPASLSSSGRATISRQYNVNLGMSAYELDFFGRVQSLKDQALEQYLATEHAKRSAQTSLVAEVASSYLTLAADRERLKLARDTYDSQLAS